MNGLELASAFYHDCVRQIIAEHIPELTGKYAAGLIGVGSDVIGNDDEMSRDHEWGPRLVLFVRETELQRFKRQLDSVFNTNLPATFQGFSTRFEWDEARGMVMTGASGGRHRTRITTPERFMRLTLGTPRIPQNDLEWLPISEQRLLEFTGGAIFSDPVGEITACRTALAYYPDHVWKYRLSYLLETLGWSLDLVTLCGKRGDHLSMHLNAAATAGRIMRLAFYLNRRYCPGSPKWLHREFSKLAVVAGDIEPFLQAAFQSADHVEIAGHFDRALERAYVELKTLQGLPELPSDPPRREYRGSPCIDTQQVSQIILDAIPGPLGERRIHGAPYGAMDQWVTNEDVLLSPEHMKSLLPLYDAKESQRDDFDIMI